MRSATDTAAGVRTGARRAARSRWVEVLGRVGLLAQGVSFAIVGILALKLALGDGGKATSRPGALKTLADEPLGKVLLVLLAIGFAGYAAWRLAQALFDRGGQGGDEKALAKRAGQAAKAALYLSLAAAAMSILVGGGSGTASGAGGEKKATAGVLGWPGGRWIVLAVGVAILVAAGFQAYRAVRRKFMDEIDESEMTEAARLLTERLGFVGLLARGVVFAIAGWFLIKAALDYDPQKAVGLGGALAKLANAPYGPWLLGLTAAGLTAFGAFCLAQARYRRV